MITAVALLLAAAAPAPGPPAGRTPVATSAHFAFYSDFDTNLNDALIAAGLARKKGKPVPFPSGDEVACFDKLPPSARAAWDAAVDYYAKVISPFEFGDRPQYLLRIHLAGLEEELKGDDDPQFVEIARSFMAAATPAYQACRWTAQNERNRHFIAELKPQLDAHERTIASRLEKLYRRSWTNLPIPVDIVETVDWSGANSILRRQGGGHLLVSTSYEGSSALEVVFHEASHTLMDRGSPVRQALDHASSAVDFRPPGNLWHVVLFYTTGDVVRLTLSDAGTPDYTPMLYGIFEMGTWGEYRQPLESAWRPYIDGGRSLSDAAAGLIEALRKPAKPVAAPPPYRAKAPLPEPALFGEGVVSTGEFESHPAFTPDGRALYFVRSTPEFTDWTIYVTQWIDGGWSAPKVAPFSGRHRDADPFVTADGNRLYFISDRPVGGQTRKDMDIWVMERTKSGDWGEPRNLGDPVNTNGNEWLPRLPANGTLYFGSDRPGGLGKTDLYRSLNTGGRFAQPQNLGPVINSAAHEYEGCIAADESFLVFMAAGRPDDQGGGDLYISFQKDGQWTAAKNLGPKINGPGLEISPYLSPDGESFFFSSARKITGSGSGQRPNAAGNGLGDIYQMDLRALRELAK